MKPCLLNVHWSGGNLVLLNYCTQHVLTLFFTHLSVSPYTTLAPHVGCSSTILMARSSVSRAFRTMLSPTWRKPTNSSKARWQQERKFKISASSPTLEYFFVRGIPPCKAYVQRNWQKCSQTSHWRWASAQAVARAAVSPGSEGKRTSHLCGSVSKRMQLHISENQCFLFSHWARTLSPLYSFIAFLTMTRVFRMSSTILQAKDSSK